MDNEHFGLYCDGHRFSFIFLIGKVYLGQSPYYESEFTYNDECIDPKVVLDMLKFADYFFF